VPEAAPPGLLSSREASTPLVAAMCKALSEAGFGCFGSPSGTSRLKPGQLLPASSLAVIAKAVGMNKLSWHAGQKDLLKAELTKCEQDTGQLTSKIWGARRAARTARTTRRLAEARAASIGGTELPLAVDLGAQATSASAALTPTWAPLSGAKDTWEQGVTGALSSLDSVQAATATYVGAVTDSLIRLSADPLLAAVSSVRSLITELKKEISQSSDFLVTSETQLKAILSSTKIWYASQATKLQTEGSSASATATQADGEAKKEEDSEQVLLGQRNVTDFTCDALRLNATDVARDLEVHQNATRAMGRLGELA